MELFRALAVLAEPPTLRSARVAEALELGVLPTAEEYTELFIFQLCPYASVYLGAEGMIGGEANEFTSHAQVSHKYATSIKLDENILTTSADRRDAQISEFTVKRRPRCSGSNSLEIEFCGKNTPAHDHSTQCPYNMFYFRQFRHRGKTFSIFDFRFAIANWSLSI